MKIGELKQKIADANGSLVIEGIRFEHQTDDDINIYHNHSLIAYIRKVEADDAEVAQSLLVIGDSSFKHMPAQITLAQYFGIDVPGYEPITVEKEVVKEVVKTERSEADIKLGGMVEAYEKILIGRGLNISR